jgi:demethylphylloquinone reductase
MRQSTPSSYLPSKSICVVGGGFAGLYTALKLEELSRIQGQNLQVTLIDKKEKFVFLPLLYELTIGAATLPEVAPLYRDLLAKSKVRYS